MSKATNENKEIIENNLKEIGLNLQKIPKVLMKSEPLNFRPLPSYDDNLYKVYKYISVQDIEILITPTDRLTDLKEKYKLSSPLFTYLDDHNEENIEKFATFLKMVSNLKLEKLEELEEEQQKLKDNIPIKVKYNNHYVWEIYYSDYAQKYFMLVPTNEQDNTAFFYVLKKKIGSKKQEKIFVPISHLEYSGAFLSKSEISDIENYMWYFTKEWPSVYEVYDKNNKMSIRIVGNAYVYEKIRSGYVVTLNTKQEAIEFYKLLKAMFILVTGAEYKFGTQISKEGKLEFLHKNIVLNYEELAEFIKMQYLEKIKELQKEVSETKKLQRRLKRFKIIVDDLTQEYLTKQKQIATFLECKKTFFGKVRYFFKKKKAVPMARKIEKINDREVKENTQEYDNLYVEKSQYTIEDLINICTKLEEKVKENTNLNLDIQAIENKKEVLSKKVDNADLYIKEIDKHKKSIFEFWKFTSKDEVQTLNEGEEEERDLKDKLVKFFDYETDLEDLGKVVDEMQRRKLSKNETDGIFAAKQVLDSIKNIDDAKVVEKSLKSLQKEYKENIEYINIKDFDIFGGMIEDKTKVKMIHNQKHREIEKDKYKVLNINLETELEAYQDNLRHYLGLIKEAFHKIKSPYDMWIYKTDLNKNLNGFEIFNINPQNEIAKVSSFSQDNVVLHRVNIKENMPLIFYSNIIFYDNFNQTLPLGMDLSTEVLVDFDSIEVNCVKEKKINVNYAVNEFEKITKTITIYEYEAKEKQER